jgi:hypothetical protein
MPPPVRGALTIDRCGPAPRGAQRTRGHGEAASPVILRSRTPPERHRGGRGEVVENHVTILASISPLRDWPRAACRILLVDDGA